MREWKVKNNPWVFKIGVTSITEREGGRKGPVVGLNSISSQSLCSPRISEYDLFGNRISRGGYTGFRVGPKSNDRYPYKKRGSHTETQRGKGHVMMEREDGVIHLQAEKMARTVGSHQKVGQMDGTYSPSEPPEGTNPANAMCSDFWPAELWEINYYYYKPAGL